MKLKILAAVLFLFGFILLLFSVNIVTILGIFLAMWGNNIMLKEQGVV